MKRIVFIPFLLLILLVNGCDDFSIFEHYSVEAVIDEEEDPKGAGLFFTIESTEITTGEYKTITIQGGKPPYTLIKTERDVYVSGSVSSDLGVFTQEGYTAGKSCGEIELAVLDSEGALGSINVFVRPKPIEGLVITKSQPHKPELNWSYPVELLPYVASFEIQRLVEGESGFTYLVTVPSGASLSFTDANNPNVVRYRIRVLAADVRSPFVEGVTP